MNVYYIGYNMDMAIEYIEACAMWARIFNEVASEVEEGEEVFKDGDDEKAIKTYTIRFASGFRIVALSSRIAQITLIDTIYTIIALRKPGAVEGFHAVEKALQDKKY